MAEGSTECGWDSLPPELLRRVVSVLLNDWAYFAPDQASDCLRPLRAVCKAWQGIVDADITQLSLTVSSVRPACLAENFPNAAHLDLSRYHHHSQDVLGVLEHMKLRSLVLADPWQPPVTLPTQSLQHLTHLSFLAEGLLVTVLASQFCEALVKLKQLEELHLSRLQLSQSGAQMLAQALTELPNLRKLVLNGGAAPTHMPELHLLLNVDLPQLQRLELMRLGVRMLPRSVSRLVGLTRLAFSGEMMRSVQLPDELLHLTNLKVLDISANLAEQLPGCVLQLSALQELHAGMNRLGVQVHNFAQMGELESLVLASNKLLALHSSVWGLTTLKRLDLGHNNLSDLPSDISSLTGLTYLNVCHNFLTALPAGLAYLTCLVDLDISLNTDMRELPTGLGALGLLTRLNASHMRLKQLPNDIGGMVSLQHLDMSHNSLHHLAPQLSSLTALTHLEASDNKLHQSTAVPEELVALTALKVLRLARNRLQSLPEALGAFSGLQVLDCSGNRLTSVPRVVGRCLALQQLLMSSNRLRGLTSGIGNLVRLQLLDLSHNQYRHLPTMTGDLTQLRELLLADNQLEDLPSSCSSLQKVTQLTLHSNRLHVLPPAISRMSGLQTLTLHDNPLLGRDAVVLHLQRQLPGLAIDSHGPLEGVAAPGRLPLPGGYSSQNANMNYMAGLFSQPLAPWSLTFGAAGANPPQAVAQQQQQQYGIGASVPLFEPPAQPGNQAGVGGHVWLMEQGLQLGGQQRLCVGSGAQQGPNPPHVYDVRTLEAAMAAQAHLQEQQQAQALQQTLQQAAQRQQQARWQQTLLQGQQPAQEGQQPAQLDAANGARRFVMLRRQGAEDVQALEGDGLPSGFVLQGSGPPQHQPWQPRDGPSIWDPAFTGAAQEQTSPDLFTSGNESIAAMLGLGGQRPQAAATTSAAAAAAGSSSAPPPAAAAAAGETPWASSGSQPGTTLEQHLAGPSTGPGTALPDTEAPSAAGGNPHSWRLAMGPPSRGARIPPVRRGEEYYRQFPGGDPEVAKMIADFKLDEVEPSSSAAARRPGAPPVRPTPADSFFGRGDPSRTQPPAGFAAAAASSSRPDHKHPSQPRRTGELEAALAAAQALAGPAGIGRWRQNAAEADASLTQYVLNRQPMSSQADAAAAGQVAADDAASTDSQHSGHEDTTAGSGAQAAAAAGATTSAGVPRSAAAAAAAAAEAEAEETPSSAADTECASDTSSEAEGVQTPTVVPNGLGGVGLSDQPATAQLARAGRQFSSAGGSGGSSSGGGAAAGSSGGGASSCGGSSTGGLARHASAPRASRLQPATCGVVGPAAAAGAGEDVDSGVECFRDPPASDGDCRGAAAAGDGGQAAAAAEGQAGQAEETGAAALQAQEGRSAGYFPFNVLQSAWWGN